ncbi:anti-repressor SinI family protein [Bacillus infantis]|uniref:anti-repressor SinI family protein n=1 Tax=Bacillus infantis TaxID=324767 RepID=UPI001CD672AA|nr:anti-repressor SinI family protein [Bacillus infantis]MCA1040318.1 anti-repressor SinI family protein [Bacillus infantis]
MGLPEKVDRDWLELILEAKSSGISLEEIHSFINGTHLYWSSAQNEEKGDN